MRRTYPNSNLQILTREAIMTLETNREIIQIENTNQENLFLVEVKEKENIIS